MSFYTAYGPFHLNVQLSMSETGLQIVSVSWICFSIKYFFAIEAQNLGCYSFIHHFWLAISPVSSSFRVFISSTPLFPFLGHCPNQALITSSQINEEVVHVCFLAAGGGWHTASWSILLNGQCNHILFFSPKKIIVWVCRMLQNPQRTFTLVNLFGLHTQPVRWAEQVWTFLFCRRGSWNLESEALAWGCIHSYQLEQESNSRLLMPIPGQFPWHDSV